MLISVEHNFAFLCVPKCASSSIEAALRPYSDIALVGPPAFRHTTYREYDQFIKPYLREKVGRDDIETVCVIREPISWLNSWYRYRSRSELRNPNEPNSTFGIRFPEFIEAYMSPNPPPWADVGCQYDFINDQANNIGVNKVFLHENIGEFAGYMSSKIGKNIVLGKENVSPKTIYKSKFVQKASHVKQVIGNRLNSGTMPAPPTLNFDLPDNLLGSLKEFMSEDFELYEKLKKS